MDAALSQYILSEHTGQIKDVNERLHKLSSLHVKEQHILDQVEQNIGIITGQFDRITIQLEKSNERLDNLERETIKKSMLKEGLKYWPFLVIMLAIIDYDRILPLIKSFIHL